MWHKKMNISKLDNLKIILIDKNWIFSSKLTKYLLIQSKIALTNDQNDKINSKNVTVANVHCLQAIWSDLPTHLFYLYR
jgi:hypothetical protein